MHNVRYGNQSSLLLRQAVNNSNEAFLFKRSDDLEKRMLPGSPVLFFFVIAEQKEVSVRRRGTSFKFLKYILNFLHIFLSLLWNLRV